MAGSPIGTVTLTGDDLRKLADDAAQRVVDAVAAEEAASDNDDGVIVVRLTRREIKQIREAAQFYARAGYGLAFLEKLGKWLAAVGAVGIAIKMLFPQLFSGGKP